MTQERTRIQEAYDKRYIRLLTEMVRMPSALCGDIIEPEKRTRYQELVFKVKVTINEVTSRVVAMWAIMLHGVDVTYDDEDWD